MLSHKMTFSQRERKEPLLELMRLKHVSKRFRNRTWYVIDNAIQHEETHTKETHTKNIILDYVHKVVELPHDEIKHSSVDNHKALLRRIILKGKYHKVLTLIEFFLRQENCPKKLREELRGVFEEAFSPYYVRDMDGCPTVMEWIDKESIDAIQQAVQLVEEQGSDKAKEYLREALRLINEKGYGPSVVHSFYAVRSVVGTILKKFDDVDFPSALKELETRGVLERQKFTLKHQELRKALEKLYTYKIYAQLYTSSGTYKVCYSLLGKEESVANLSDAVFMFGACACLAEHLINKHRDTKS